MGLAAMAAADAAGKRDEAVYGAVEAARPGALDLLKSIVDIDSGTGDAGGGERGTGRTGREWEMRKPAWRMR